MRIETNPEIDAKAFQYDEPVERVEFSFTSVSRREFVNVLGAGLLIAVVADQAMAQEAPTTQREGGGRRGGGGGRGGREQAPQPLATRVHIGEDGAITVMTGKVECGQGARAELTQAAAEELGVAPHQINLLMADTSLCPDDWITAGSRSTPTTVPAVRQGAATARELLVAFAAKQWGVQPSDVKLEGGRASDGGNRTMSYADLAKSQDAAAEFKKIIPSDVKLASVKEWKVMGASLARPNGRDVVTGKHQYPSDVTRPGMLYGKVLRAESYGAKLKSVDTSAAKAMKDVTVVEDNGFVGVVAPTSFVAKNALGAIAKTAEWEPAPHPSSKELWDYLRQHARGGVPENPFASELSGADKQFKQTYHVPYVQHCPMEPRAAVAEWSADGKLTVWTGTQNPFGVRGELSRAFGIDQQNVRVIVPDFGGGFGGKHTGECAVEAARLAKAAGKPVSLRWTRQEEFTWAYFRAGSVIDIQAGLDAKGNITSWFQLNINHGNQSVETPYKIEHAKGQFVPLEPPPLRHGSYRSLASAPNTFAREAAMDELAALASRDPLEFRLSHLENPRLRAVVEAVTQKFNWTNRVQNREPGSGVGLACGIDKGSYVATCALVSVDPNDKSIRVRQVCQAYECGAIVNPDNLINQVRGGIIMGLGPALREAMEFENGRMRNATFWKYNVPRFEDVPELDVVLLNRTDLPSAGAGETPLIAVAPAIANAVFNATGTRVREMPVKLA